MYFTSSGVHVFEACLPKKKKTKNKEKKNERAGWHFVLFHHQRDSAHLVVFVISVDHKHRVLFYQQRTFCVFFIYEHRVLFYQQHTFCVFFIFLFFHHQLRYCAFRVA